MTEIRLTRLVHRYPGTGAAALDGLDLTIPAGSTLGLLGRNGSGKSTLIAHLVGILRPTAGRVLVGGRDAAELRVAELARIVGVAIQDPARQIVARRVADEIAFGPRMLGIRGVALEAAVTDALAATGLTDAADENPWDLGPSRRRLLGIAAVLAMRTPIVVLDEPTAGLDDRERERVGAIVRQLTEAGRTTLVATHDVRFAAEHLDRLVLLDAGRILLDGTPAELLRSERSPVLAAAGIAPPPVAREGERLGLVPTPSDAAFVAALRCAESEGRAGSRPLEEGLT